MQSAHKPVFIPPKKRVQRAKGKGSSSSSSSTSSATVRRIHSYDIVTCRLGSDGGGGFSGSPMMGSSPYQRAQSQEAIPLGSIRGHRRKDGPPTTSSSFTSSHKRGTTTTTDEMTVGSNEELSIGQSLQCSGRVQENSSIKSSIEVDDEATTISAKHCTEASALNGASEGVEDGYLTLTGTIKRGKKAGQSIDVKLNMSREELDEVEAVLSKKLAPKEGIFGLRSGLHVLVASLFSVPLVFFVATCYAFYLGTFTWYNMYLYFSEERSLWHRVFFCPFLVLTYPFWVAPASVGVGLYAALIQVSWHYDSWIGEVQDLEKGFYGWLCASLRLVDCSPYEVVILNDVPIENEKQRINEEAQTSSV